MQVLGSASAGGVVEKGRAWRSMARRHGEERVAQRWVRFSKEVAQRHGWCAAIKQFDEGRDVGDHINARRTG